MAQFHGACAGKEHIVHRVVVGLVVALVGTASRKAADRVDFIKGKPVFAALAVPLKQCFAVPHVAVDGVAAGPSIVFQGQCNRQLIVMDRDQRLHSMFFQFVKNAIVEAESCFIGFQFIASREDPAPADGEPINIHAHACQQCNIFFVTVVMVNRFVAGIVTIFVQTGFCAVREGIRCKKAAGEFAKLTIRRFERVAAGMLYRTVGFKVMSGQAASVLLIGTLKLKIRSCTAPQKVVG